MGKSIIPIILLVIGIGSGGAAGLALRPPPPEPIAEAVEEGAEVQSEEAAEPEEDTE